MTQTIAEDFDVTLTGVEALKPRSTFTDPAIDHLVYMTFLLPQVTEDLHGGK